jgi:hypothetical protein
MRAAAPLRGSRTRPDEAEAPPARSLIDPILARQHGVGNAIVARALGSRVVQRHWLETPGQPRGSELYRWHEAVGGLRWYFHNDTKQMSFHIEDASVIETESLPYLKALEGSLKPREGWLAEDWVEGVWNPEDARIEPVTTIVQDLETQHAGLEDDIASTILAALYSAMHVEMKARPWADEVVRRNGVQPAPAVSEEVASSTSASAAAEAAKAGEPVDPDKEAKQVPAEGMRDAVMSGVQRGAGREGYRRDQIYFVKGDSEIAMSTVACFIKDDVLHVAYNLLLKRNAEKWATAGPRIEGIVDLDPYIDDLLAGLGPELDRIAAEGGPRIRAIHIIDPQVRVRRGDPPAKKKSKEKQPEDADEVARANHERQLAEIRKSPELRARAVHADVVMAKAAQAMGYKGRIGISKGPCTSCVDVLSAGGHMHREGHGRDPGKMGGGVAEIRTMLAWVPPEDVDLKPETWLYPGDYPWAPERAAAGVAKE